MANSEDDVRKCWFLAMTIYILGYVFTSGADVPTSPAGAPNIHKVAMTQKGYIQFLKYKVDVPPLHQFTFCIWMKSYNYTHSHPILSYSKHERDKYIRSRVVGSGFRLKTSLMEQDLADVPLRLKIHRWYHICQSWDTNTGKWEVYLNGELKSHGLDKNLRDVIIPGGGDLVVGQEYTDFDKGLDDGIEGEIFGFNMILSSTTEEPNHKYYHKDESRNNYQSVPVDGIYDIQNDYVRLADFDTRYVMPKNITKPTDEKTIVMKENKPRKINPDTLKLVTDNYYNIDVDYTTFAPEEFKKERRGKSERSKIKDTLSEATFLSSDDDDDDDLLIPPLKATDMPFWFLINKAGREGKFRTDKGEIQPLALNNLPVYETPPGLPIYDDSQKSNPSFEVLYSQANFKGNQWYDQNDYFPKELLRRPKTAHKGHGRVKSKSHHHHGHHGRPHKKDIEPFPYPSEHQYVYIRNSSGDHSIFRRDLSTKEKNIEILNPDSIIVYPIKNEILNVQVYPRGGVFLEDAEHTSYTDDDDEVFSDRSHNHNSDGNFVYATEESKTDQNIDEPSYEVAYARLHYTGTPNLKMRSKNNNIKDADDTSTEDYRYDKRARYNNEEDFVRIGGKASTKRYPQSITDKINEADQEDFWRDDSRVHEQFGKSVKLGNALNELKIFRQHGNDKINSFVGSVDFIPDIHRYRSDIDREEQRSKIYTFSDVNVNNHQVFNRLSRKNQESSGKNPKSAGRKLVELSYRKCLLDRGSPLAKDAASLISWTLTPMRVFGGALLKNASPSCGHF